MRHTAIEEFYINRNKIAILYLGAEKRNKQKIRVFLHNNNIIIFKIVNKPMTNNQ